MWAGNRQSSIQHAPGGARGGEDDVFDELIDKAGAGTEDGIDKTGE